MSVGLAGHGNGAFMISVQVQVADSNSCVTGTPAMTTTTGDSGGALVQFTTFVLFEGSFSVVLNVDAQYDWVQGRDQTAELIDIQAQDTVGNIDYELSADTIVAHYGGRVGAFHETITRQQLAGQPEQSGKRAEAVWTMLDHHLIFAQGRAALYAVAYLEGAAGTAVPPLSMAAVSGGVAAAKITVYDSGAARGSISTFVMPSNITAGDSRSFADEQFVTVFTERVEPSLLIPGALELRGEIFSLHPALSGRHREFQLLHPFFNMGPILILNSVAAWLPV